MTYEILGFVAAATTTLAFLPQVVQTVRSGSTEGLNLPTLAALAGGVSMWIVYGFGIGEAPVVVANAVTLGLVGTLLFLKLRDVLRPRRGPAPAGGAER